MRVLISGAGIVGPTLAWYLAMSGTSVDIVEKAANLLAQGQNIDVQGSAITALKKMGVFDEVRRWHTTEKGSQFVDSKGRSFAPFPQTGGCMSPTSDFEILRGDLATVLYEATKDCSNIKYYFDTTIKTVLSNDNHCVKVELSNGEVQQYDLLVAADGQWSRLRKQCFPSESVHVVDKHMYAAYFTIPRISSDNDLWNIYLATSSRAMSTRPDPHNTTRATFTLMPCNNDQKQAWQEASRGGRKMQHELLRREFTGTGWQSQRLIDAMDQAPDFYFQAIQQIRMSQWSNNRVVCVGDAAYAPTPLTGAGCTLAITGAYVLAGELSKLDQQPSHTSLTAALDAYEGVFRPHVEKVQDIPSFIPGIVHPEKVWQRWLCHAAVSTLSMVARLANPWLNGGSGEANDDGFPLPYYAGLDLDGKEFDEKF